MPSLTNLLAVNNLNGGRYLTHACSGKNGGCSHLCILLEDSKRRCGCPLHLVLSSDRATCVDTPECPPDTFRCMSETTCLPVSFRCDGRTDCDDMSDEMSCVTCEESQFRCQNGDCVEFKYRCDGTAHCRDHSDEQCCNADSFLCRGSYECVNSSLICDSKSDCSDSSDESDCTGGESAPVRVTLSYKYVILIVISISVVILVCLGFFWNFLKRKIYSGKKKKDVQEIMMTALKPDEPVCSGYPQQSMEVSSFNGNNYAIGPPDLSTYDRNHLSGASSSSLSWNYPFQPPPSLVTIQSQPFNPPPSLVTIQSQPYVPSHCSVSSYRHCLSVSRAPPPSVCSTDVCDDIILNYDSRSFVPSSCSSSEWVKLRSPQHLCTPVMIPFRQIPFPYEHYDSKNIAPPASVCGTDFCDDSSVSCDSEPFIPSFTNSPQSFSNECLRTSSAKSSYPPSFT